MFWWLNPVSPCCDPSLTEPVKLPFSDEGYSGSGGKEDSKFIFGRKGDCSIKLKDQSISGHHCSLHYDIGLRGLVLIDTSTNGTFLNGKRLTKSIPVKVSDGDEVSLTRPKLMDDNITYHAVFKLVFSSVIPGSMEDEKQDILDSTIIEETQNNDLCDKSNLDIHVQMEDINSNNDKIEDVLDKTIVERNESISSNVERRSLRSSINLRSQERKYKLNLKEEGVNPRKSRGRLKSSEKDVKELHSYDKAGEYDNMTMISSDKIINNTEVEERTIKTCDFERKKSIDAISQVDKAVDDLPADGAPDVFEFRNGSKDSFLNSPRRSSNVNLDIQNDKSPVGESVPDSNKRIKPRFSSMNSSDMLMDKLENLEVLVSRKESLERSLRSELEARDEEIARLRDLLERSEVNERELRQHNMSLIEDMENIQKQNVYIENELIDYQERCRVLNASGEAMDQTISQLSEELSTVRQELLTVTEQFNRQNLALKSVTQLTQKKCLMILSSLKDIHQINSTYSPIGVSCSVAMNETNTNMSIGNSVITPWRSTKRTLSSQYVPAGVPQTERPYKMRYSPINSKGTDGYDTRYMRRSSIYGNNYSSFGDNFENINKTGISINNSNGVSLSGGRFLSGYLQLEEQLNSNIRPSSCEVKSSVLSLNRQTRVQMNSDEMDKLEIIQQEQTTEVDKENQKLSDAKRTKTSTRSIDSACSDNLEYTNKENNVANI
ncbi:protein with forkhead associated (FHA) domain [Cryptosporidium ryanae]|uniref:protein with forkhead associated (FHA) domain n=1 Tax=Cryptosporidium ryanae TaxID=515981 RepID=UPI00351A2B82|nr:protein with forkhead associated (FHA) domain [Cryptosporidium ryanae]